MDLLLREYSEIWEESGIEGLKPFALPRLETPKIQIVFVVSSLENPKSNALLTKIIEAMGFKNSDFHITEETPDLQKQIERLQPEVLVVFGQTLAKSLRVTSNIAVTRTHSLQEMLQNPSLKKDVWDQMKLIMKTLQK